MKYSIFFFLLFLQSLFSFSQNESELNGEIWNVSDGKLQYKNIPEDSIAALYWDFIYSLLPSAPIDQYVSSLELFSDGESEELGGMTSLNDSNSTWGIDVDTIDFNFFNRDSVHILGYVHTIIHEFGHLLTLSPDQVFITEDVYQDDSIGYLTSEGYAKKDSYLRLFVKQFWEAELLPTWDEIDRIRREPVKLELLFDFYLNYTDHFLTDYAAESPEEDIAESWTYFVLSNKPFLNDIKHQKVLFFYQFPELVSYRKSIRKKVISLPQNYIESFKLEYFDE